MKFSVLGVRRGSLLVLLLLVTASLAQTSSPQASPTDASAPASTPTFRSYSRLVTVEVVAKDRHGHHLTGLKPEDYQVFKETANGKDKRQQKMASFQEINFADMAKQSLPPMKVPAGAYRKPVTLQNNPLPPTILMIDGLNPDIKDQA